MKAKDTIYLYEAEVDDFHLTPEEQRIMKKMRELNAAWKAYLKSGGSNRLILYGGSGSCSIRIDKPSKDHEIEAYEFIRSDGGDGGDKF